MKYITGKPDILKHTFIALIKRLPCPYLPGGYCVLRHLWLRQHFVGVYVAATKSVVDSHKDYIQNSGHTEHVLFVKCLLQKDGVAEIKAGPESASSLKKKVRKPGKQKLSKHLKLLLRAPGKNVSVKAKLPRALRKKLCFAFAGSRSGLIHEALSELLCRRCRRSLHGPYTTFCTVQKPENMWKLLQEAL